MTRLLSAAPALLVLMACNDPAVPGDASIEREMDAGFQTMALAYQLDSLPGPDWAYRAEIPYTFTNPLDEPVYIANCGSSYFAILMKELGVSLIRVWSNIVLDCRSPPIVIPPGEQFQDTLRLVAGNPDGRAIPRFEDAHPGGTYFLRFGPVTGYSDETNWGTPLPDDLSRTNRFILHPPGGP